MNEREHFSSTVSLNVSRPRAGSRSACLTWRREEIFRQRPSTSHQTARASRPPRAPRSHSSSLVGGGMEAGRPRRRLCTRTECKRDRPRAASPHTRRGGLHRDSPHGCLAGESLPVDDGAQRLASQTWAQIAKREQRVMKGAARSQVLPCSHAAGVLRMKSAAYYHTAN